MPPYSVRRPISVATRPDSRHPRLFVFPPGLWQSLQLMKKVDANEEGIDRLSQVIEATIARLKKVRKHTDRLDKQLAVREGEDLELILSKAGSLVKLDRFVALFVCGNYNMHLKGL